MFRSEPDGAPPTPGEVELHPPVVDVLDDGSPNATVENGSEGQGDDNQTHFETAQNLDFDPDDDELDDDADGKRFTRRSSTIITETPKRRTLRVHPRTPPGGLRCWHLCLVGPEQCFDSPPPK